MSGWFRERFRAAVAAAATLTGKRFGLLVASSLVATSAIVAAAATNKPEASPLAATLVGRSIAADRVPAPAKVTPVEPEAEPEEEAPAPVTHEASPAPEPEVIPTPEATPIPEEVAPAPAPEETPPPEEEGEEETPPAEEAPPTPEAGRIKHVFVISLVSSGYQAAFGKASQMPYLSGTLRPQGTLLANYSVLDKAITPNGIAAVSGQPPNKATKEECPKFTEFPPDRGKPQRRHHRRRLRLAGNHADPGQPADHRRVHHPRLHGKHGQPDHRRTGKLRPPRSRRNRRTGDRRVLGAAQSVHPLPGAGQPRRMCDRRRADHRTEERPEERIDDRERLLHLPRSLLGGGRRAVPGRGAERRRGRGRLARRNRAADRRIEGVQEGRPADRQLRRGEPARRRGRRPTGAEAGTETAADRGAARLPVHQGERHRQRSLRPLLAAALDRGTVRLLELPGEGGGHRA